ncbi:MAG: ComEC/Rec2 family competence protein [Rhabdochlamydiaceae bacterium]|nr:ComEC/Rec2 family competence protein [Rhabdochlamydiaceae bacterium]
MSNVLHFYRQNPAFIYAIFFLLGLSFASGYNPSFLIPLLALSFPFIKKKQKLLPLTALFVLAFIYGHITQKSLPSSPNTIRGTALFVPSEVKWQSTHFKKTKLVKGKIVSFLGDQKERAKNIPCSIALAHNAPSMNSSFYIQGTLQKTDLSSHCSFEIDKHTLWIPASYTFSFVEKRFQAKEILGKKIHKMFSDNKVADFMTALTLGTLEDRMLKFEFGRLGLQHILAISGFHFGLFAWFSGLLFRLCLPKKAAYIALFLALTSYFILLGNSPSILRAYLAISLFLMSRLGNFRFKSLNLLGVALLTELLIDPCVISHLGFQLSFLATFAIVFFLPTTQKWMLKILPYRTLEMTTKLSPIERIVYLFSSFLRGAFALNIAVTLWTLPVCLFHFHTFPLLSIFYNLFIPIAFSLSLFLFFVSLPFLILFPPLATFLTSCNQLFTGQILQAVFQSPPFLHLSLRIPFVPVSIVLIILLALFFFTFQKKPARTFAI